MVISQLPVGGVLSRLRCHVDLRRATVRYHITLYPIWIVFASFVMSIGGSSIPWLVSHMPPPRQRITRADVRLDRRARAFHPTHHCRGTGSAVARDAGGAIPCPSALPLDRGCDAGLHGSRRCRDAVAQ